MIHTFTYPNSYGYAHADIHTYAVIVPSEGCKRWKIEPVPLFLFPSCNLKIWGGTGANHTWGGEGFAKGLCEERGVGREEGGE